MAPHAQVVSDLQAAEHLNRILAVPVRRRHKTAWRVGATLLISVGIVGGGSMALASNGLETPWGWVADNVFHLTSSSGQDCFNGMLIISDGPAENSAMMRQAREILRSIDATTLDTTAKEAELREPANAPVSVENPSPVARSDSQIKQMAMQMLVTERLWDTLRKEGYDEHEVNQLHVQGQSTDCR